MPLWEIFHHPSNFTPEQKESLSKAITNLYHTRTGLPEFYVVVIFQPVGDIYKGGVIDTSFIRIVISHLARESPQQEETARAFQAAADAVLKPFIADRGFNWEYSYFYSPRRFWKMNGLIPPPAGSDEEKLWFRENRPVPYQ